MDYLDPRKQARHTVILYVGYILIAVAIVIASIILVNQAYGYGIGKNGTVIQNSLAFFSSRPNPANIYINGALNPSSTNTRLYLPAGIYKIDLTRSGYNNWERTLELDGGQVEHFDYPFLFPKTLTTTRFSSLYSSAPSLMTQSPDGRWLVIIRPNDFSSLDVYDLKNPTKPPLAVTLPPSLFTKAVSGQTIKLSEWADDNQHILIEHDYDTKKEFILADRITPALSVNLNIVFNDSPTKVSLINKKYDQYHLYDANSKTLEIAQLSTTTKKIALQHVLAYRSYGDNTLLYVTDDDAPVNKVLLRMMIGSNTYTIHSLPVSPDYLVDLTQYSGTMYVAAGATNGSKIYIYKDPIGQLALAPKQAETPVQVLSVDQPNYLSFSNNAQFIVAENASKFGVYDIENQKGFNYISTYPIDQPMVHATWMDGNRLVYVSGGKLFVFDYDYTNLHRLETASSSFVAAFAPDYKFVYNLVNEPDGSYQLNQTSLLAPADR